MKCSGATLVTVIMEGFVFSPYSSDYSSKTRVLLLSGFLYNPELSIRG
jgi:hypothetical protein